MNEFERELERNPSFDGLLSSRARSVLIQNFNRWHSPEHIEKEIQMQVLKAKQQQEVHHMDYCEPQQALPLLPDYVAKFISDLKTRGDDLSYAFWCEQEDCASDDYNKAIVWMDSHPDDFARAWLDGYTAEKQKTLVSPCPVCGYKDVSSNFCSICGHKNEYVEDGE